MKTSHSPMRAARGGLAFSQRRMQGSSSCCRPPNAGRRPAAVGVHARSLRILPSCRAAVVESALGVAGVPPAPVTQPSRSPRPVAPEGQRVEHEPWNVTAESLADVVTMFKTLPYEHDYWVQPGWVTGTIPRELRGTYFRNGPGLQVTRGGHTRHFMDGDGCVVSLAFPGGGAMPRFTNRYVRTKGFEEEQAASRPLHRNAFTRGSGNGFPFFNPLDLTFKNVANTGVLAWAGRLWALWEAGRPYELCPHTLGTLGESDLDGQIGPRLAGHYRTLTEADGTRRAVLFGTDVSFAHMQLEFYEMDEAGHVVERCKQELQGLGPDIMFVHDMLVTEHWYCVIMGPVKLDIMGFLTDYLLGKRALGELMLYKHDQPSKVVLIPRPGKVPPAVTGPPRVHTIDAPPFFTFHHINAYEAAGGAHVVIDTISWEDIAFEVTQHNVTEAHYANGGCRSHLYRLVVDMASDTLLSCQRMLQRTLEFPSPLAPTVVGREHRHAYCTADAVNHPTRWGPGQAVLKMTLPAYQGSRPEENDAGRVSDGAANSGPSPLASFGGWDAEGVVCEEWRAGRRRFPQEPMFIPRPGATIEDDGWVLVGLHDAETQRGAIAILDAQRIADGPVATIQLPHALPLGLHGTWTSQYLGPDPADPDVPAWRTPHLINDLSE